MLLEALSILQSRGPKVRAVIFDNFDDGPNGVDSRERFLREVGARGLTPYIQFLAPVSIFEMPSILGLADVGIIAYNREFGINSLPGRFFEYMASGLATIIPSYSPDMCEIIDRERCGIKADCEDPTAVADALCWCAENREEVKTMGILGRTVFESRYSWEREMAPLAQRIEAYFKIESLTGSAG